MQINRKTEEFNLLEKEERDIFIQLQAAMKTSHEKEKIHTNSAKYWSIVGTLAGKRAVNRTRLCNFTNVND